MSTFADFFLIPLYSPMGATFLSAQYIAIFIFSLKGLKLFRDCQGLSLFSYEAMTTICIFLDTPKDSERSKLEFIYRWVKWTS